MRYKIEENERKIREYFERKYNVNFSNIEINVVRKILSIGVRGVKWGRRYSIRVGSKSKDIMIGMIPLAIGFLFASQGNPLGYGLIYLGSIGFFLVLGRDVTLGHEYAHITWWERIYRFEELFGNQTQDLEFKVDNNLMEAFAEFEAEKVPVSRTSKIGYRVSKILSLPIYLLVSFPYQRYVKLFKQLEEINPEKPRLKNLDQIITKVDELDVAESYKQLMRELFQEEYKSLDETAMLDWIENSPAILPEKSKILEKLIKRKGTRRSVSLLSILH